ncbi:MAG: hypothetical protein O2827_05165 [Verrucomicrobia bacterium]|nr:hypothetical protein [Verrucomicrobiota bacterium]
MRSFRELALWGGFISLILTNSFLGWYVSDLITSQTMDDEPLQTQTLIIGLGLSSLVYAVLFVGGLIAEQIARKNDK